jgi:cyanophycinase
MLRRPTATIQIMKQILVRLVALTCLNIAVVNCLLCQGSVLLVGGGSEDYGDWSDQPYRWLVDHAPNKVILVMHYSDGSAWLESYFRSFGATSATSLVISTRTAANDSTNYRTILGATGLFLRGGDQWQYVNLWRGTLVEKAIRELYQRGGVVGGTSAGEAVLSEIVFDAQVAEVDPRTALRNPLGASITLTDDFLRLVPSLLVDSHFFERGRLGRLGPMLSLYKKNKGREIVGVGIDANTAMAIGPDGVGEVMGSGTATVLRFAPETRDTLEASKPYAVNNLRLDQLTPGFKLNVTTGEITPPQTAISFSGKSVSATPSMVVLDGSNSNSEWSSGTGSLRKLQAALNASIDTVGIFSSPASTASANTVRSSLAAMGVSSQLVWIDESKKNDAVLVRMVNGFAAFVFVGNSPDSVGQLLSDATLVGRAFESKVASVKAMVFLSDDVMVAGETGIGQMYGNIYGAYYGYLTLVKGLAIIKGVQFVPRLFENSDYTDNRMSAVFWAMGKSNLAFGVMLDAGAHVVLQGSQLRAFGSTPVLIVDARSAKWTGFPTWIDPGKTNPRQNAAFVGARFDVIRSGSTFGLGPVSFVSERSRAADVVDRFELRQNYPNPFNGVTSFEFQVPSWGIVHMSIFDVLGREVTTLTDGEVQPGTYRIRWDAGSSPSGVYFARLQTGSFEKTIRLLLLK